MKIWQLYFIKQTAKFFFLILFSFYGIYVLIDYAHHSSHFRHQHGHIAIYEILTYYTFEFLGKAEVLIPFAFLIACIKTLTTLNLNNELVALMTGGIKLKKLLQPFLWMALTLTILLYLSNETLLPSALKQIRRFEDLRAIEKQKKNHHPTIKHLNLEDESLIIFQNYDSFKEVFLDAYWIKNPNEIYRIKSLQYAQPPIGHFVEHLTKDHTGNFFISESLPERMFPEMKFNQELLIETLTPPEELSYTELQKKIPKFSSIKSEKEAKIISTYYYKLAMPWLSLLAFLAISPFCLRFTRNLPTFLIYSCSIFSLVAFYLTIDATLILGERQVLNPLLAIYIPFTLAFTFFGFRYLRL